MKRLILLTFIFAACTGCGFKSQMQKLIDLPKNMYELGKETTNLIKKPFTDSPAQKESAEIQTTTEETVMSAEHSK